MKAIGCDLYNQTLTDDIACALTATMDVAGHSGPKVLILNDQGGSVMDVQEDITATLRAQDHGHPPVVCLNFQGSKSNNVYTEDNTAPSLLAMHGHDVHVVCFEPGILSRDCSAGNRAYVDVCSTLRAQMGDNQPAVCFRTITMNERQISMMISEDLSNTIAATDYKGSQVVCYESKEDKSVVGVDLYNQQLTGDVAASLIENSCATASRAGPYFLIRSDKEKT